MMMMNDDDDDDDVDDDDDDLDDDDDDDDADDNPNDIGTGDTELIQRSAFHRFSQTLMHLSMSNHRDVVCIA